MRGSSGKVQLKFHARIDAMWWPGRGTCLLIAVALEEKVAVGKDVVHRMGGALVQALHTLLVDELIQRGLRRQHEGAMYMCSSRTRHEGNR